jgi:hypothetical protein
MALPRSLWIHGIYFVFEVKGGFVFMDEIENKRINQQGEAFRI